MVKAWVQAFRPKTLTAALVPILVGTALVAGLGHQVKWWVSGLALLASFFIQIGTNLVNDAIDFKKGADTEKRIGPQRVTQAGIFSHKTVLLMGSAFFAAAVLCGVPLVIEGGAPIFWIGVASVVCGYIYTAGPFPLAYTGMGDIFVVLFFGLIAVGGLVYLHTGEWLQAAWIAGLVVGLHCTVLIAVNNLRDVNGDVLVNKKTLPVRFGVLFGRVEITLLAYLPFALGMYWLMKNWYWAAILPLLAIPSANRLVAGVWATEPSPKYNQFLAQAALLHLKTGVLLTIGILLHTWIH